MIINDPNETLEHSSTPYEAESARAAEDSTPLPDPRKPIETLAGGNGTVTDPGGTDTRPPVIAGLDLFA
jgi:hypothetical protein